jgi:hypothetical protein
MMMIVFDSFLAFFDYGRKERKGKLLVKGKSL